MRPYVPNDKVKDIKKELPHYYCNEHNVNPEVYPVDPDLEDEVTIVDPIPEVTDPVDPVDPLNPDSTLDPTAPLNPDNTDNPDAPTVNPVIPVVPSEPDYESDEFLEGEEWELEEGLESDEVA